MSSQQKSKSKTDVPLLPKAIEIMERYKDHPICRQRGSVLPVKSNQKMNEYLKEIAVLCNLSDTLNTHKARHTFASTVTLKNGVPIHVVKEMMGHHSVRQTEEYAITQQESISEEMNNLKNKLSNSDRVYDPLLVLKQLEQEVHNMKSNRIDDRLPSQDDDKLDRIVEEIDKIKKAL